jgi:hypothetical protein
MDILGTIKNVLTELTKGKTLEEKKAFIDSLGYASFSEIERLDKTTMRGLLTRLDRMLPENPYIEIPKEDFRYKDGKKPESDGYINFKNGYKIRRGETAADTGFIIPGHNINR